MKFWQKKRTIYGIALQKIKISLFCIFLIDKNPLLGDFQMRYFLPHFVLNNKSFVLK